MAKVVEVVPVEVESSSARVGPGLHAMHVEMATDRAFRVRSLSGERLAATLADGVERELIEECLRGGQLVIVTATESACLILGSLQTQRSFHRDADGTLGIEGRRIELRAEEDVRLTAGASAMTLNRTGRVRINGHRMTLDIDTSVRILSALVELP